MGSTFSGIGLSPNELLQLFPFHVIFDRALQVLQNGSGWQSGELDLKPGVQIDQVLRCVRPASGWNFDRFCLEPRSIFVLTGLNRPLTVRGGMRYLPAQDVLLFLGSPWVTELAELDALHLKLSDFPPHDALPDLLFLLQAQKSSLQEMALLTKELTQATEAAEKAVKVKGEFIANMSHELRTPLNGMLGMVELALATSLSPEQIYYLKTVRSSASLLGTIVNDILDFSTIDDGKMALKSVKFDVRHLFQETLRALSRDAEEKGLELLYEVEPDVPATAEGDPLRLHQIVANLANNAIKFSDCGEVSLRVSRASQAGDQWTLQLEVRDTGIGIAPDRLDSIFQPFTQADGSTTRKYGGTGLGLSMSRRLAEAMDGTIVVDSEYGSGSRFTFTAVLKRDPDKKEATKHACCALEGVQVLVVDDNASQCRIVCRLLSRWGMQPTAVQQVNDAIEALQSPGAQFLVVLVDAGMPNVNGSSLCQQIRNLPGKTPTTIILLPGPVPTTEDIRHCEQLGGSTYLRKPVSEHELAEALLRVLADQVPKSLPDCGGAISVPATDLKPLRILLAEDNPVNQQVAVRLLTKNGHSVRLAKDGLQAVEAWEQEPFDVILMDLQMPNLDGCEAARQIRKRERAGQHTPIVAVTANASHGIKQECLQAGMNGHVPKPVKAGELWAELHHVLESKS